MGSKCFEVLTPEGGVRCIVFLARCKVARKFVGSSRDHHACGSAHRFSNEFLGAAALAFIDIWEVPMEAEEREKLLAKIRTLCF